MGPKKDTAEPDARLLAAIKKIVDESLEPINASLKALDDKFKVFETSLQFCSDRVDQITDTALPALAKHVTDTRLPRKPPLLQMPSQGLLRHRTLFLFSCPIRMAPRLPLRQPK